MKCFGWAVSRLESAVVMKSPLQLSILVLLVLLAVVTLKLKNIGEPLSSPYIAPSLAVDSASESLAQ